MPSDLTLKPDYVFETTPRYNTLVTEFENGVEQRRAKWATSLTSWKLQYKNRSPGDLSTIKTLFNAKLGAFTAFNWDNPDDGQTWTVRFKDDSLTYVLKSYGLYDFEFELLQVK